MQHVAIAHTACTIPNPLTLGVDRNVGIVLDVGQCCTLEEQGHIRAILPSPPIFFNGHGMASADGSDQLTGEMGRCYRSISAQGKTGRWELKGFTRLEGQGGSDHIHRHIRPIGGIVGGDDRFQLRGRFGFHDRTEAEVAIRAPPVSRCNVKITAIVSIGISGA